MVLTAFIGSYVRHHPYHEYFYCRRKLKNPIVNELTDIGIGKCQFINQIESDLCDSLIESKTTKTIVKA